MALNKDVLGAALNAMAENFNEKDIAPENITAERLNFWKGVAEQIINHIKTAGVVNVNVTTTGTAAAQAGTGIGAMS